jgi:hypothetical protein
MSRELIPFRKFIFHAHPVAVQRNSARAIPCEKIDRSILNLKSSSLGAVQHRAI